jgi:acyl-CoA synthetase (AMP-forming)/AMP-acid ligase II
MNAGYRTNHAPHVLDWLGRAGDRAQCHVQFVTPRGTVDTSFSEIWSLSTRMASAVPAAVPTGRIAGVLTPSPEMVACFVGCLRAGRDFVSLPLPGRGQDPVAYAHQLCAIAAIANIEALVVEAAYADLLRSLPGGLSCPVFEAERLAEQTTGGRLPDAEPGELIQFSSGTTGTPKGIRLGGEAIAASVEATLDRLQVGGTPEAFCAWIPLSHDMGLIGGLLGSWVGCGRTRPGYRYTCVSPELFMARPWVWMEICSAIGATVTAAPTFAYHLLVQPLGRGHALDLAKLRACIVGAEPIASDTLRSFAAAASRHGFREHALCPGYGLAEMGLAVSMVAPGEGWTARAVSNDGKSDTYVSCGKVLRCASVDAPDIASGAGPIRVSGPALSSGYLPPRAPSPDGWLDTGDLGVLADGELFVTGRSDDLLCVAGRNLFAWEIERAASAVSQVRPGACVAVTDGRGRYVLLFEPRAGAETDLTATLAEVRRKAVDVAGIGPSAVGCLPRGAIAKTPSGKLRRNSMASDLPRLREACLDYKEF